MPEALQASRALLFPGPLAPLSHFGVTLLRHAVASGLRYSFYHLGLPLPEPPPLRIVGLRLYLDGPALAGLVAAEPGGPAVAAAALDPAGEGGWPPGSGRVRAAAAFHRLRLLAERQPPRRARAAPADPERLWRHFRGELSRLLAATNEALLAEIVCSLARRARRAAGKEAPPCLSLAAWRLCRGGRVPLGRFGPPDPLRPSWARAPGARAAGARGDRRRAAAAPRSAPRPLSRGVAAGARSAERDLLRPGALGGRARRAEHDGGGVLPALRGGRGPGQRDRRLARGGGGAQSPRACRGAHRAGAARPAHRVAGRGRPAGRGPNGSGRRSCRCLRRTEEHSEHRGRPLRITGTRPAPTDRAGTEAGPYECLTRRSAAAAPGGAARRPRPCRARRGSGRRRCRGRRDCARGAWPGRAPRRRAAGARCRS